MKVASGYLALAALTSAWGCGGATHAASQQPSPPTGSPSVVTMEELARQPAGQNLYDALLTLRPAWFRMYPTTIRQESETDIVVYLDRSRLGGPDALRTVERSLVRGVRHYTPSEAQIQFGPGNMHGAIQVITQR